MECQKHEDRHTASYIFGELVAAMNRPLGIIVTAAIIYRALHECGESCPSLHSITVDRRVTYRYTVPPDVDADPRSHGDILRLIEQVIAVVREASGDVAADMLTSDPMISEVLER